MCVQDNILEPTKCVLVEVFGQNVCASALCNNILTSKQRDLVWFILIFLNIADLQLIRPVNNFLHTLFCDGS